VISDLNRWFLLQRVFDLKPAWFSFWLLAPRALRVEGGGGGGGCKNTRGPGDAPPHAPIPPPRAPLRPAPRRPGRMSLRQPFRRKLSKISQFDLRYKHQRSTSPTAHGTQLALINVMSLAATGGGFSTPNSEVWDNVTARASRSQGWPMQVDEVRLL
jgi:hypothetical protein